MALLVFILFSEAEGTDEAAVAAAEAEEAAAAAATVEAADDEAVVLSLGGRVVAILDPEFTCPAAVVGDEFRLTVCSLSSVVALAL